MNQEYVETHFPIGKVKKAVSEYYVIRWLWYIIYIGISVLMVWLSGRTGFIGLKMIYYGIVAIIIWKLSRMGEPLLYIGTEGIVIQRRTMSAQEYIDSMINPVDFYYYVAYENIIGFTADWRELQITTSTGAIMTISVDLAYVSTTDKNELLSVVDTYKSEP